MEFIRTANAGGLLKVNNVSVLIDGVCEELFPYIGTPVNIRNELEANYPDIVAYTHKHKDHYDEQYIKSFKKDNLRSVCGPGISVFSEKNGVEVKGIKTRHIGKEDISHLSYIISGDVNILFTGDASPLDLKNISYDIKPDVIIAPFAYATTEASLKITESFNPKLVILIHFPLYENDTFGIWDSVCRVIKDEKKFIIPEIGEKVIYNK